MCIFVCQCLGFLHYLNHNHWICLFFLLTKMTNLMDCWYFSNWLTFHRHIEKVTRFGQCLLSQTHFIIRIHPSVSKPANSSSVLPVLFNNEYYISTVYGGSLKAHFYCVYIAYMSDINQVKEKKKYMIGPKHFIMFKELKITEYVIANQSTQKPSVPNGINVFVTYGILLA